MAEPTMLIIAAKKAAVEIISDPERALKFTFKSLLMLLGTIMMLLAIPTILIVSLPVILFNGGSDADLESRKQELTSYYQEAPSHVYLKNEEWIEKQKTEYSWADDIVVEHDFTLDWRYLITLDSVRTDQEFGGVTSKKIIELGNQFMEKKSWTEKYEVEESRTRYWTDKDGKKRSEDYYVTVTKTRAIISVTTKTFDEIMAIYNFKELEKWVAENMLTALGTSYVEGQVGDLEQYPPGNADLPYFNQGDARWGNLLYGNSSTIRVAGCGPTALAMVIAGMTGRNDIDPKVIADWSVANGHRAEGVGSYWSLMTDGGKSFGLNVSTANRNNPNKILDALSKGQPVIVSMGRGHFTTTGHFIVLRGLTEDGKVLVHDSASVSRSQKAWDINLIMNESSTNGGSNGSPFWIFK